MTVLPIGSIGAHLTAIEAPSQAGGATEAPGLAEGQTPSSGVEAAGRENTFAGALGQALNSLESSQAAGETASAQVATGTTSDPEGAVVKAMDAELEMQLASQIRTKATEAVQTIFQTQV